MVLQSLNEVLCVLQFLPNFLTKMLFLLANQLPAGLITTDGQQQNVMVYTTSYQQVLYPLIHSFIFLLKFKALFQQPYSEGAENDFVCSLFGGSHDFATTVKAC